MSYDKAAELLRLAWKCAASRQGITYAQVAEDFGMSERNAKRMVDRLGDLFEVEKLVDEERRARFRIREARDMALPEKPDTTLEALELALRGMEKGSAHAVALEDLRHAVLARLDRNRARKAELDAETFLQAYGHIASAGPRVRQSPEVMAAVGEALRGPFLLRIAYGDKPPRVVQPYGILQGVRGYLVAKQPEKGEALLKFRLDQIHEAVVLNESFPLDEGFDIAAFAAEGFGVWHDPKELKEVVWRFVQEVAQRAAEFVFHPGQSAETLEDGSLLVRFTASGWTEMTWYLYKWGDKVEVLEPPELRAKVAGYQRADIDALP